MTLYAVVGVAGGYAREDAGTGQVYGLYSSEEVANTVRKGFGFGCTVQPVELDVIPPGVLANLLELGFKLPEGYKLAAPESESTIPIPS
ncbi:hypothetical protein HNP46_006493 [Pseudomonas nitritireducens]|uniref:Uncharacterized protein n=1 Tax=Pseudomonas nitroreducens TaxID=46680 RepID=A0A7W7KS38_PSENT|nr:hypothetical protein [Pseudomonas nitritireducens]MBB4867579.1 hypothetical protein [Pseudomonas nitritireducens]